MKSSCYLSKANGVGGIQQRIPQANKASRSHKRVRGSQGAQTGLTRLVKKLQTKYSWLAWAVRMCRTRAWTKWSAQDPTRMGPLQRVYSLLRRQVGNQGHSIM